MSDIKIFIDAPDDERLLRIIRRDIRDRGCSMDCVFERYLKTVKPMHDKFILPSKKFADIIFPNGAKNIMSKDLVSIKVLSDFLRLNKR